MHLSIFQTLAEMPARRIGLPSSRPALWLVPLSLLWLTACATPLCVAPGASETQVRARFGPPAAEYRIAGQEGPRFEYDTGPVGRLTYMVDFGPDGRAVKAWQALTVDHFAQIRIGVDTADSVRQDFGNPARIVPSSLGHGQTIWEYPYVETGVWNSLMNITFDAGGTVRYIYNCQDPQYFVNR